MGEMKRNDSLIIMTHRDVGEVLRDVEYPRCVEPEIECSRGDLLPRAYEEVINN
jgi:hypothetical protein